MRSGSRWKQRELVESGRDALFLFTVLQSTLRIPNGGVLWTCESGALMLQKRTELREKKLALRKSHYYLNALGQHRNMPFLPAVL